MNIGIFSGSFDPVHVGHLILANYITEFTEIEEVWFLVSPQNPFKPESKLSAERVRLEMVKLALRKYNKLKPSDFEFRLPKPSYTINTLDALQAAYPEHQFTLIIGGDNWNTFENWREHDRLLESYGLKVYPRAGSRITIPSKLRDKVDALESPIIEVSSTFIRESIADGKDVRAFLPGEVYDYIVEKGLYRN
jgi:nicotinate-nucleotide adenylyltransferase